MKVLTRSDVALGGTQDNGTQQQRLGTSPWNHVFGGDGAYVAVDYRDNTRYVSYQNGNIFREDNGNFNYIMDDLDQDGDGSQDESTYFIAPFFLDEHDPNVVYYFTRESVWVSLDRGNSWNPLTGPISRPFSIATQIVDDKLQAIIGGANAAFFHVRDVYSHTAGTETNLRNSVPAQLSNAFLREMVFDAQEEGTIYAVFSSFSPNPRVYRVSDVFSGSPVWESVSSNLPPFLPVNAIQTIPSDPSALIIGTDYGVYTTVNSGESWELETNIPQAPVFQMDVTDREDVFIFTHGRGVFTARFPEVVSNKDHVLGKDISAYPNPANEIIWIDLPAFEIEITCDIVDLSGRLITQIEAQDTDQLIIPVHHLENGTYIFSIRGPSFQVAKKDFSRPVDQRDHLLKPDFG